MPIQVTCTKCKTQFKVSDKFAGKQGPCPKCKTVLTVPETPPPEAEIQIHAPEEYAAAGKTATGQGVSKPILRKETRISPVQATFAVAGTVAAVAIAWALRATLAENLLLRILGLLLVSAPIARAGYSFLREEEIEPHRGAGLWIRCAICGLVYAGIWGVLNAFITHVPPTDPWYWVFIAPAALGIGAGVAFATLDLDLGNGFMHCCFYVMVTLGLAAIVGLRMPWVLAS